MGFDQLKDPAAFGKVVAITAQSGVAAGTGDNTELTSAVIDRVPTGLAGYASMLLAVCAKVTLASAQTLALTVKIADSADGSTFGSDVTIVNAATVATGVLTNSNQTYELGINLSGYKRYVQFKVTANLSASATDTFVYGCVGVLGGSDRLPV